AVADNFTDIRARLKANSADGDDWLERSTTLPLDWLHRIRPPRDANWPKGDDAWKALAGEDGSLAYRALHGLISDPAEAVRVFRSHLSPVRGEPPERIAKLIEQLDARRFADREAAVKALTALGVLARPAVVEALKKNPSAEVTDRLQRLLESLGRPEPSAEDV